MCKMPDFLLVGTANLRTYFYLNLLKTKNIRLHKILIYGNSDFDLGSLAGERISLLGYTIHLNHSFKSICLYHQAEFVDFLSINENV